MANIIPIDNQPFTTAGEGMSSMTQQNKLYLRSPGIQQLLIALLPVCVIWLFVSIIMPKVSLAFVMAVTLVCAFPVAGVAAYLLVVRKTRQSQTFKQGGWLAKVLGLRFWAVFLIFLVSIFTSFFMLIQLAGLRIFDWAFIILTAPVFITIYRRTNSIMRKESVEWLVPARALKLTTYLTPVIMLLLYGLGLKYFGGIPVYASLDEARVSQLLPLVASNSAFLRESAEWSILLAGYRDYVFGQLSVASQLNSLLLCFLGYGLVFTNICAILGFIFLPSPEYRRIFLPLVADSNLPRVSPLTVSLYVAVLVMFILMAYLPGVAWLEQQALIPQADGSGTVVSNVRQATQNKFDRLVIAVEGTFYDEQILGEIDNLRRATIRASEEAKKALTAEYNGIFDRYERNIDSYLDWYYSLSGEYTRLAKLVLGDIETYMIEKFTENISKGVDTNGLSRVLDRYKGDVDEFNARIQELQERYKVREDIAQVKVVRTMTKSELLSPFKEAPELLNLKTRVGTSIGGGLAAGAAAGVIAGKVAQKATFKIAAKALFKVAAAKGAGIAGTTAAGAAIGSVVPGPGTAVGGAVGLVVGTAGSLMFEKGLLMLEDAVKREEFKAEIKASIEEHRRDVLSQF
jgi:hypothetical protein